MEFPTCPKCQNLMLPLSDYGDGASVLYKAWACINDKCAFSLRVDKGQVTYSKVKQNDSGIHR